MRWRCMRFFFYAEKESSKQGHFAKNDSLFVGNTFPNPNECSAGAAVVRSSVHEESLANYFFRPDFRISRYSISASVLIIALYFP